MQLPQFTQMTKPGKSLSSKAAALQLDIYTCVLQLLSYTKEEEEELEEFYIFRAANKSARMW